MTHYDSFSLLCGTTWRHILVFYLLLLHWCSYAVVCCSIPAITLLCITNISNCSFIMLGPWRMTGYPHVVYVYYCSSHHPHTQVLVGVEKLGASWISAQLIWSWYERPRLVHANRCRKSRGVVNKWVHSPTNSLIIARPHRDWCRITVSEYSL